MYELSTLSEYINSVEHYYNMSNFITQLETNNLELNNLYNLYPQNVFFNLWKKCEIKQFLQSWSNGSGGWESVGGSVISKYYTTVFYNEFLGIFSVYYTDRLAYIAKIDDKSDVFFKNEKMIFNLPGMYDCKKKLNVIYKNKY